MLFVVGKTMFQSYKINQEVETISNEIEASRIENEEYLRKITYYKSNEYKEKIARERLGMQKTGEQVIVILPQAKATIVEEEPIIIYSNPEKWWRFFFVNS
jgi:cell division protein FtsB